MPLNQKARLLDPSGQLFVLKEEEAAVRANNARKVPLAIRANAGEDCVDILFKSELPDSRENAFFSKVNIHIHFAQFDIQGSDGVTTGFNYEQSIRPFATEESPGGPGDRGRHRGARGQREAVPARRPGGGGDGPGQDFRGQAGAGSEAKMPWSSTSPCATPTRPARW